MARARKAVSRPTTRRTDGAGEPLYLVRRLYEADWESIFCNSAAAECPERAGWGAPVKAFTNPSRAADACAELVAKYLDGKNPFELQGAQLSDLTTFPPGPFRDWLLDVGLEPPPSTKNRLADWRHWWKKKRSGMSAEQHHRLLTGLNKLRFYDVVELEPPRRGSGRRSAPAATVNVITVTLRIWKDDDDFLAGLDADRMASIEPCFSESGLGLATFRDRARATAYRDQLQQHVPDPRGFYRNGFAVDEHPIEVGD
jgi:hypothetical protein